MPSPHLVNASFWDNHHRRSMYPSLSVSAYASWHLNGEMAQRVRAPDAAVRTSRRDGSDARMTRGCAHGGRRYASNGAESTIEGGRDGDCGRQAHQTLGRSVILFRYSSQRLRGTCLISAYQCCLCAIFARHSRLMAQNLRVCIFARRLRIDAQQWNKSAAQQCDILKGRAAGILPLRRLPLILWQEALGMVPAARPAHTHHLLMALLTLSWEAGQVTKVSRSPPSTWAP